jgi:iron complex outermembrane receptor protein
LRFTEILPTSIWRSFSAHVYLKPNQMKKTILLFFALLALRVGFAQHTVSGTVNDFAGEALIGVTVFEKGTTNGTTTDVDGNYSLTVSSTDAILSFTYVGYKSTEVGVEGSATLNIIMEEGVSLDAVLVVGSRSYSRSSTNSPVAVDVIDLDEIPTRSGQVEINQLLQYVAPSFNASKQSGSDGADHIDPATLRGLGPDQTLVLINGKRRHQSSLINVFGTRGRGNTGTDLNAIPISAIERIEVLRDGASAQYGSDAIAGVINIVLKEDVGELNGSVTYGAYSTNAAGEFADGTANAGGTNRLYDEDASFDGATMKIGANYGVALNDKGGFANISTELLSKDRTLRPGASFRQGFGEAALDGFNFMINSGLPLGDDTEVYGFGGRNFRNTDAYAFTRENPTPRNVVSIYPDGFTPRITSTISDASASVGIRHAMDNGWNVDFNNTYGKNYFHYYIRNTLNASLENASPTDFDAGGHSLAQNVTGLDFSKFYKDVLAGTNLAFGLEYRTENFQIFAGEEGSYATYDVNGLPIFSPLQTIPVDTITGEERPGGSQGFPGYSPANEVDRSRSNVGAYLDGEFNITDDFLVAAAIRYEDYSDFGNTFNYKLAARYNIMEGLGVRASVSSGFRAPSLAQVYYNLRFTNFVAGEAQEVLLSPNNSPVTRAFGIDPLKEETAQNLSVGVTYSNESFTATIDAYQINIQDRIVLTDYFDASSLGINVVAAQFFANGIDTKTQGVDIVLNWKKYFGDNRLNIGLTGNINDLEILAINSGDLDPDVFFRSA